MPLVNTDPGAVHLELANSERKKGYYYAKISFVTTKLNVNYTNPKLPPFLNSNPGNGFVDVAKFVPYNDLVKDLPIGCILPSPAHSHHHDSLLSTTRIPEGFPNTNTPRCSPETQNKDITNTP